MGRPLIFTRYKNRKLYHVETKSRITLDEIAEIIQKGQEVKVIDHPTQKDITPWILKQISLRKQKKTLNVTELLDQISESEAIGLEDDL